VNSKCLVVCSQVVNRIGWHCGGCWDRWHQPAVRPPELGLAIRPSIDLITLLVDGAVMPTAERREIRQGGGTAVSPVADVMALAKPRPAAGEATASITVLKRAP
jgi:hypothetical protein